MRSLLCTSLLLIPAIVEATKVVEIAAIVASNASQQIPPSFVSYSIELSSFPDFAGNHSYPNDFSDNLLQNIAKLQGSNPYVRVGGNTQDYALYNASQQQALIGYKDGKRSPDYPTTISIGSAFFESYGTWHNISFIHGFNLANNGSAGVDTIKQTIPLVCKALNGSKLEYWQLGNEPDLYKTSSQGAVRPKSWNERDYVTEWLNKTEFMRTLVQQSCPDVIQKGKFRFSAPGFGGTSNSLNMLQTWKAGLNNDSNIAYISSHNYIGGATQPGVTLQHTLMNHTSTVISVNKHLVEMSQLKAYTNLPYILGEANSLYNQGAPSLSDSFGAALWVVDFNLYCAAAGIKRVHMHQGTNYRYASWQPIATVNTTKGTKAPYYGNIMVATMLGDLTKGNVTISDLEQDSIYKSAYATYVDGQLVRLAVIQMREFNYTITTKSTRPTETFSFQLSSDLSKKSVTIQRLMANGSNAITGVTFDGYSYNYELNHGKPVLLANTTRLETLAVGSGGVLNIEVPWSSAAIINFDGSKS